MKIPTVSRAVHYVSYGTPGGEYPQACRAAIVTEVTADPTHLGGAIHVGLCVLNPTGQFFNRDVPYDPGGNNPDGHNSDLCGGLEYEGGTWHWPEIVQ